MPLKFGSLQCFCAAVTFLTSSHLTLGLTVLSLSGILFWYQCRFIEQILELLWNFNVFLYLKAPGFLFNFFLNISSECPKQSHIFHKSSVYWWRQDTERACRILLCASFFLYRLTALKLDNAVSYFPYRSFFISSHVGCTAADPVLTYTAHLYKRDTTGIATVLLVIEGTPFQ